MFVSKLLIALISPLGSSLALGGVGLLLGLSGLRRWAWGLGGLALAWLWLCSLPVSGAWLRGQIEREFPAQAVRALPRAQAIVLLGGAIAPPDAGHPFPDLSDAADRVWHASRLYHGGRAPLLVLSGGRDPARSRLSEAEAMQVLLRDLDVPDSAILLETQSRTTRENARFTARLLRERGIDEVLLAVTSALHMHRALRLFSTEGLRVTPAATDHRMSAPAGAFGWLPDAGALQDSGWAIKEWIGQRFDG